MSDDGTSFSWDGHETWYQVVGALDGACQTPVVDLPAARARPTTTSSRSPT
jgi:hypothetical protein